MSPRVLKTDSQILAAEYPEPEWIIPDLLPEGYTVLAGLPKLGKSVIGLQIAEAVASGGVLFNKRIQKGRVLYIAVEDTERRLQRRMKDNCYVGTGQIFFANGWDALDANGFAELERELRQRHYRVCILDTLFRMFSPKVRQNDSGSMALIGDKLQNLAKPGTGLVNGLIGLDHHNKGAYFDDSNNLGNLSGSISKVGAADTLWNIYRKRKEKKMRVEITGRDVEEQDLELVFDPVTKCYQVAAEDDVKSDTVQDEILKVMIPNQPTSAPKLAVILARERHNISRELGLLVDKGKVIRAGKDAQEQLYIKVYDPLDFLNMNNSVVIGDKKKSNKK